jgi:transposase
VVGAKSIARLPELMALASSTPVCQLPDLARECVELLLAQLEDLQRRIAMVERSIATWHRAHEVSRRLETIPGIGVITATAITAFVSDATSFRSARQFAAWVGLAPRLSGTGGRVQLGRISKAGNRYLRRLLTIGATSVVRCARRRPEKAGWITALLARRPTRVVITAVANKLARIVWALLSREERFRQPETAVA